MCKFKCLWRTQMTFWAAADWPIKMSSNHASMPETRPDASDSNILWNQSCQRIWLEYHNGFGPIIYYYESRRQPFLCFLPKNGEQGQHILHFTYRPKMPGLRFQHFLPKNYAKNQKLCYWDEWQSFNCFTNAEINDRKKIAAARVCTFNLPICNRIWDCT